MFKYLYTNLVNLNLNNRAGIALNIFSFLKKSSFLKNYSNYLNFYITVHNALKIKTIQTSSNVTLDNILPLINILLIVWFFIEILPAFCVCLINF